MNLPPSTEPVEGDKHHACQSVCQNKMPINTDSGVPSASNGNQIWLKETFCELVLVNLSSLYV